MWKVEGDSGVHQAFGTLVTQGFFPSSVSERSSSQFCTGPLHRRKRGRELLNWGKIPFRSDSAYRKLRLQRVFPLLMKSLV